MIIHFDQDVTSLSVDFTLFDVDGFLAQAANNGEPTAFDIRMIDTGGDWTPAAGRTWTAQPGFYAGYAGGSGTVA